MIPQRAQLCILFYTKFWYQNNSNERPASNEHDLAPDLDFDRITIIHCLQVQA